MKKYKLNTHIQIGCQQLTHDEFYLTFVEQALVEGITEKQFKTLRNIINPLLLMLHEEIK